MQNAHAAGGAGHGPVVHVEVELALDWIIAHVAELLVFVLVGLEHERDRQLARRRRLAGLHHERRVGGELRVLGGRGPHVAGASLTRRRRGESHGHGPGLLGPQGHAIQGQSRRPRAVGEFDGQMDGPLLVGVVVDLQGDLALLAGPAVDRAAVGGEEPAVRGQREERPGLGRPERGVRAQVVRLPAREPVGLHRGLLLGQMQAPGHGLAMRAGREGVGRPAAGLDRNGVDQPVRRIEQRDLAHPLGQTGNLDAQRPTARQKADVDGPTRIGEHQRLLVAFVAVAAGGLDQVLGAVGGHAPEHLLPVAILRHGDVQAIHALARDLGLQPDSLRGPEPARREAVVRDGGLLDDAAVRPDQDGPQLGPRAAAVAVAFLHVHYQRPGLGQEVRPARPADSDRNLQRAGRARRRLGGIARQANRDQRGPQQTHDCGGHSRGGSHGAPPSSLA